MKRHLLLIILFILTSAHSANAFIFPSRTPKSLILLKYCSDDADQIDISSILAKYPSLKLNLVFYPKSKPSAEISVLISEGKAEALLRMIIEPQFSLFYSSMPSIGKLSRFPEDPSLIVLKNHEEFKLNFGVRPAGLVIDSGNFCAESLFDLKRAGVSQLMLSNSAASGVFPGRDIIIYSAANINLNNLESVFNPAGIFSNETILVLELDNSLFTDEDAVARFAEAVSGSTYNCLLISQASRQLRERGVSDALPPQSGFLQLFENNSKIIDQLYLARKAIEDYKNSGQAAVKTLEALKDAIYSLYDYRFLRVLVNGSAPREVFFASRLNDIASLTDNDFLSAKNMDKVSLPAENGSLKFIDASESKLKFNNIYTLNPAREIASLSIFAGAQSTVFEVAVTSSAYGPGKIIEIYMDMNNKRGAGSVSFLDCGNNSFKAEDAWEYVLRFEADSAVLIRSTRAEPVMVKKFKTNGAYRLEIPASVLKGSPLKWGYQAVLTRRDNGRSVLTDYIYLPDTMLQDRSGAERLSLLRNK